MKPFHLYYYTESLEGLPEHEKDNKLMLTNDQITAIIKELEDTITKFRTRQGI